MDAPNIQATAHVIAVQDDLVKIEALKDADGQPAHLV